jgi:hypothetical protein
VDFEDFENFVPDLCRILGEMIRFELASLTSNHAYIKPLESLLLRIARPSGNRVSGGFGRPINLYRSLHRAMSEADADRRARILGGHVARRLRRRRTRDARGSLVLAGLVDRRLALQGHWKRRRFKATLRRDGYVSFKGRKYDSPSAAGRKGCWPRRKRVAVLALPCGAAEMGASRSPSPLIQSERLHRDSARIAVSEQIGATPPEDINDGELTAPSKRLIAEVPDYEYLKAVAGPAIAAQIGLPALRAACPHFHTWITRLEGLVLDL